MSDTSYGTFQHYGTNAQRLAFTPSPPSGTQPLYVWYETDTGNTYLYATSWHQITSSSTATPSASLVEGRLTTQSGVPVSTSDRTAQSTLYYTPALGSNAITNGNIALYNGSNMVQQSFTQLSLVLSALTSGKNYDVFVDYNSGTPQLVLSAAWASDTSRTDALGIQSGLIIKSGTPAYRWVGTIRTTGTTTIEDSSAKRFVWNAYQQVRRMMLVTDATDSWNYSTATIRQANGNAANQLDYVTGDASSLLQAHTRVLVTSSTLQNVLSAIGVDSTTANSSTIFGDGAELSAKAAEGWYTGYPGLGRHTLVWLESGAGSGTQTWYGDNGGTVFLSGIEGTIWN